MGLNHEVINEAKKVKIDELCCLQPHFVIEANEPDSVFLHTQVARCSFKLGLKISQEFSIERAEHTTLHSSVPPSLMLLSQCPHQAFLPSGLVMTGNRQCDH